MLNRWFFLSMAFVTAMTVLHGSVSPANAADKDIVTTAVETGSFKTLAAALKAAGLEDTLQGKGPYTVFAPTDEAFAKLPAGTVESLLKPENKEKLVAILTFHVVPGRILSSDVLRQKHLKTVQGSMLSPAMKDGVPTINGAEIVITDIDASNGVIHAIDRVMLPQAITTKTSNLTTAKVQCVAHFCPSTGRVTDLPTQAACRQ